MLDDSTMIQFDYGDAWSWSGSDSNSFSGWRMSVDIDRSVFGWGNFWTPLSHFSGFDDESRSSFGECGGSQSGEY
jgi:hypothetical protein